MASTMLSLILLEVCDIFLLFYIPILSSIEPLDFRFLGIVPWSRKLVGFSQMFRVGETSFLQKVIYPDVSFSYFMV